MNRLNALSAVETKTLLSRYFEKVINLREKERKTELQCSEMEVSDSFLIFLKNTEVCIISLHKHLWSIAS